MYIVYYDEAGDDGFPQYSSPLFVLTSLCIHHKNYQETFKSLQTFRKILKQYCGFPIKTEMHTRNFLLNKSPYKILNLTDDKRLEIIDIFCNCLASLPIQITNVVINKKIIQKSDYNVLDRAFTYSLQRIENTISNTDPGEKYLVITDEGRINKMRLTARRIQKINYIPSQFSNLSYRSEIKGLIEDPLTKDSSQSYFIQVSDMISYIIYQYKFEQFGFGNFPSRMPNNFNAQRITKWLDSLTPVINLKASPNTPYGIVCYPK